MQYEWTPDAKTAALEAHKEVEHRFHAKSAMSLGLTPETIEGANWNRLTDHQKIGAAWLTLGSSILADEMGSGKTVQACVAAEDLSYQTKLWQPEYPAIGTEIEAERPPTVVREDDKPEYYVRRVTTEERALYRPSNIPACFHMLVVCPLAVMPVWETHLKEWTTIEPFVVRGTAAQRRKIIAEARSKWRMAIIINWEGLKSHSMLAGFGNVERTDREREPKELNDIHFSLLIADEAHRGKSPRAKQTRALWAIDAKTKWALTGTPIANSPQDFWSLLRFIAPEDWTSRVRFTNAYCEVENNPWSGGQVVTGFNRHRRAEFDALTSYRFLRRKTSQVIGRVIKKNRIQRYATLSTRHREFYELIRRSILEDLDGSQFAIGTFLARTTRLAQAAAAMLVHDEEEDHWHMTEEGRNPSPKINCLMDLEQDLDPDERVVIVSPSRQLMRLASARYEKNKIHHSYVDGETGPIDREEQIQLFKDGANKRLLCTTGAMSEGVDLAVARKMVFLGRPWSMVQSNQTEDRIYRLTQSSDSVDIIDIITEDTIDQRIYEVLDRKHRNLAELTRDELLRLV